MLINELIDYLNHLCFRSSFYNSIFDRNNKVTTTRANMNVWWIMVESIDVYQYALYDEYGAHMRNRIDLCKDSDSFLNDNE